MGELTTQLLNDPNVGSFFRRHDVVAAEAAVSSEAKDLLSRIVRDAAIPNDHYTPGALHHLIVHTLHAAFSGRVAVFFHDLLIDVRIRDAAIVVLRDIASRSNPPTCPLEDHRLPLVQQLLAVADLRRHAARSI